MTQDLHYDYLFYVLRTGLFFAANASFKFYRSTYTTTEIVLFVNTVYRIYCPARHHSKLLYELFHKSSKYPFILNCLFIGTSLTDYKHSWYGKIVSRSLLFFKSQYKLTGNVGQSNLSHCTPEIHLKLHLIRALDKHPFFFVCLFFRQTTD